MSRCLRFGSAACASASASSLSVLQLPRARAVCAVQLQSVCEGRPAHTILRVSRAGVSLALKLWRVLRAVPSLMCARHMRLLSFGVF